MKIAIDLTSIPSELTGVGIYVENLLSNLPQIDPRNEYYVFVNKGNAAHFLRPQRHFNFIVIRNQNKVLRIIWEQFILPIYLLLFRVDLLHSPHYTTPLLAYWVKRIVTFPDMTFFLYPDKHERYKVIFFQWMIRKSAQKADRIISISDSTTKDIIRILSVNQNKIRTIYLSAADIYQPIANQELIAHEVKNRGIRGKYILFVGTIEPRKNIMGLLKAYFSLAEKIRTEYQLVIVGKKGWYYDEIFSFITEQNGNNDVVFTGYIEEAAMPLIINGAALFVYPSFYEGFGLPVLEALACGTPVITSNISSMPEVAGNAARLVDPNNIASMKMTIESILANDQLQTEMSQKGIEQASKYSWEKCARETLQSYQEG